MVGTPRLMHSHSVISALKGAASLPRFSVSFKAQVCITIISYTQSPRSFSVGKT